MSWETDLQRIKRRVEAILDVFFRAKARQAKHLHPLFAELVDHLHEFTLRPGKRLRPFLVTLGWRATGRVMPLTVFRAAAAIECFHDSLLIHDDLIDRDAIRRGQPTMHKVYEDIYRRFSHGDDRQHFGLSTAILAGNLLNYYGSELLLSVEIGQRQRLAALEYQSILETTNFGQFLDMVGELRPKIKLTEIDLIHYLKTARYSFEGPLVVGAILAGASRELVARLRAVAIPIGLAFQLQDDMLGLFGNQKEIGKSVVSDLHEGKKTVPLQYALSYGSPADKKFLQRIIGNPRASLTDLRRVRQIVRESGAYEFSRHYQHDRLAKAETLLRRDRLIDPSVNTMLRSLSHFMILRSR